MSLCWHVTEDLVARKRFPGQTCLSVNPVLTRVGWECWDHLLVSSRSLAVDLQFGDINVNQAKSIVGLIGWF